jgi:hypothetical protein
MTKNVGYDQYWDTGGGLHFFSTDLSLFNLPHSRDSGGSRRLSHPLHRYFHNRDDRAILGSPRRTVHIVVSPGIFQLIDSQGHRHRRDRPGGESAHASSTTMVVAPLFLDNNLCLKDLAVLSRLRPM